MESRREHERRRTLKEGRVILSESSSIDCVMRDLSAEGARLRFAGPTQLPERFQVLVVSEQALFPAERMWQRGLDAGIRFTGPQQPAPPRKP